jgi:hypothetical protein
LTVSSKAPAGAAIGVRETTEEQRLRKVDLESLLFDELPELLVHSAASRRFGHDEAALCTARLIGDPAPSTASLRPTKHRPKCGQPHTLELCRRERLRNPACPARQGPRSNIPPVSHRPTTACPRAASNPDGSSQTSQV